MMSDRSLSYRHAYARTLSQLPPLPATDLATRAGAISGRSPVIVSDALLQGAREVEIRHGDQVYRLRHTRNDKLILTK